MKKIYCFYCFALAVVLVVSCQREPVQGGTGAGESGGLEIPAGFMWKTTRDVSMDIGMPVVPGTTVDYAVIRVYSSPKLIESNMIAKGVVSAAKTTFHTAFTLSAVVDTLFVQTTLPDGTTAIRTTQVASQINLAGVAMKSTPAVNPTTTLAAPGLKNSSMPTYPTMSERNASDFTDPKTIISTTPSSLFTLGAEWGTYAAAEYYIPAGAEVRANIDMNGGHAPYKTPVLYVKGKLTLSSINIGQARLAILPGGEVTINNLTVQPAGTKENPVIYLFEGGKLSVSEANISGMSVVNNGTFIVTGELDLNNKLEFYNTSSATLTADELKYSNIGGFYNDGTANIGDLELNSDAEFDNCENGVLTVRECSLENGSTTLYQKGQATFDELSSHGRIYVNCYTYAKKLEGDQGKIFIASGACLEAYDTEFQNTDVDLAPGSLFITNSYNTEEEGSGNITNSSKDKDAMAVVQFTNKAICDNKAKTDFRGPLELVYDDSHMGKEYQIDDKYFKGGAYMRPKQSVNIPAAECNKGKGEIEPDPEEKPDYSDIIGEPATYCFEDNWPWTGDYDMNDVVVRMSIDRRENQVGAVEFIKINWEVLASGATHTLSFGVMLDRIMTSQVASVVNTNSNFGAGAFADARLEAGSEYAVIPFFNMIGEVLAKNSAYINTAKGASIVPTTKHSTTVTFAQPVAPEQVTLSNLNAFIVVNPSTATTFSRANEVHLAGYNPTVFADVSNKNSVLESDPYRYFKKDETTNRGMMWGMMIPGTFRYPSERSDIRIAYRYFKVWANSGGNAHAEWYLEEANEQMIY